MSDVFCWRCVCACGSTWTGQYRDWLWTSWSDDEWRISHGRQPATLYRTQDDRLHRWTVVSA